MNHAAQVRQFMARKMPAFFLRNAGTTVFDALAGRRVLVIADAENLSFSLHRQGRDLDYRKLLQAIKSRAKSVTAHAFACVEPGAAAQFANEYFAHAGWLSHVRPIQRVAAHDGMRRRSNCDNYFLLGAGHFIGQSAADTVVLATGDGDLAADAITHIRSLPKHREIVTMGIPGSISRRLDPQHNPDVAALIELGRDMAVPINGGGSHGQ